MACDLLVIFYRNYPNSAGTSRVELFLEQKTENPLGFLKFKNEHKIRTMNERSTSKKTFLLISSRGCGYPTWLSERILARAGSVVHRKRRRNGSNMPIN